MPATLDISNLSDRAAILYCHVSEWHDPDTGTCGSFGLVEACAILSGLGKEFTDTYGTSDNWGGAPIDLGELIHWAHNCG